MHRLRFGLASPLHHVPSVSARLEEIAMVEDGNCVRKRATGVKLHRLNSITKLIFSSMQLADVRQLLAVLLSITLAFQSAGWSQTTAPSSSEPGQTSSNN